MKVNEMAAFEIATPKPKMNESKSRTIPTFRVTPTFYDDFEAAELQRANDVGYCSDRAEYLRHCLYFAIKYMRYEKVLDRISFHGDRNITIQL